MTKFAVTYEGDLRCRAQHAESGAVIQTDASKEGELFSPTDLLAVSLGTCVMTVMAILADRLKVDLKGLRADVQKEMAAAPSRRVGKVVVHLFCPQRYDPDTTAKLEEAGRGCPIHHSLHPDTCQEFIFHWGMP